MPNLVMMALGAYRFSLDTAAYQQLVRQTDYNWQEQQRVSGAPLMQHTGGATDQITLEGLILPAFRGGTGQVAQMRLQAGLGIPLSLITGLGNYMGQWVITSIGETQEVFWDHGQPRKIEFQLTLRKYNEPTVKIMGHKVSTSGLLGAIVGNIA